MNYKITLYTGNIIISQVKKDVSPGKRKVLRENAKSYAEKYMPDMHPIITDALKTYEDEVGCSIK